MQTVFTKQGKRKKYSSKREADRAHEARKIARKRTFIASFKNRCVLCGETHPACLDFHHLDDTSKEFNISRAHKFGYGYRRIAKEIEKCVVLCSNCHRKLHYGDLVDLDVEPIVVDRTGDLFS